jgi:hypothetical protein
MNVKAKMMKNGILTKPNLHDKKLICLFSNQLYLEDNFSFLVLRT